MRFKVGQKVQVVKPGCDDNFNVGDIVQIDHIGDCVDPNCYVVSLNASHCMIFGSLREYQVAPITNGDKIRAMSNRELSEFLSDADYGEIACEVCPHRYKPTCTTENSCIDGIEAWLNSEAEDK